MKKDKNTKGIIMTESFGKLIERKLKAAFLATFIVAMAWICWNINTDEEIIYHLGTHFYSMTLTYFFYIGFFVLIYGIFASFIVESFQREWFERADWLYVLILGVCGSAIGLVFPFKSFIIAGILIAVLYGTFDKWLQKRWLQDKGSKALFIAPFLAFVLLGGFFQFTSPSLPSVTAEDAVEFTTTDKGTKIDDFPKKVGTWEGKVDGYEVERTTAVEQLEENFYLVTFTESWQNSMENGTWMISYQVDRESMTLYDEEGDMPPYDMIETPK